MLAAAIQLHFIKPPGRSIVISAAAPINSRPWEEARPWRRAAETIMFEGHDPYLVALSVVIAILGGYTGFGLAARIRGTPGVSQRVLLSGAAGFLAIGIWTMHFVGMLAAPIPPDAVYLVLPTIVSFLICVLVVGVSLFFLSIGEPSQRRVISSAVLLGRRHRQHALCRHPRPRRQFCDRARRRDDPAVDRNRDRRGLWRPARVPGSPGRHPADRKLDRVRRRGFRHALHRDVRHAFCPAFGSDPSTHGRACRIAANPVRGGGGALFRHRGRLPVVAGAGSAPADGGRRRALDRSGGRQ